MKKRLFTYLFFACFGITAEIFFVAFGNLITQTQLWDEPLWSLTGKTYVWMFPIYMLIPIIAGSLFDKVRDWHIVLRLLLYVSMIYLVEFSSGFLLEQITGKCPWEYTTGWHIMGYIRLDYLPSWTFFAFIIERLYLYLDQHLEPSSNSIVSSS